MNGMFRSPKLTVQSVKQVLETILNQPFPFLENGNVAVVDASGLRAVNIAELRGCQSYSCAISHAYGIPEFYYFIDPAQTQGRIVIVSREVARLLNFRVMPVSQLEGYNSRKLRIFYPGKRQMAA
jgi:hypothetical protein